VRNLTFALCIIVGFGVVIGVIFSPFAETLLWPTDEMATRGVYLEMMFGAIIAMCGGAAVAVSESNEEVRATRIPHTWRARAQPPFSLPLTPPFLQLTGVAGIAISSALVPPAVNSGICFSFMLVGQYVRAKRPPGGLRGRRLQGGFGGSPPDNPIFCSIPTACPLSLPVHVRVVAGHVRIAPPLTLAAVRAFAAGSRPGCRGPRPDCPPTHARCRTRRYFTDYKIEQALFFKIATASIGVVCINSFFIYSTAFVVFKARSGNTRFLHKKSTRNWKKLDKRRRDSIMLASASMADEEFGGRGSKSSARGSDAPHND
jgi:hypothetical protein